jgi:phenylalanyl-tRNA synthetase beta chain
LCLDEKVRKLRHEDIMVCDGHHQGMCMGGVFGGAYSGVTDDTKRIFLEAAHFNSVRIRKTSMSHILRTDAAKCFEKGTDPNITVVALNRSIALLQEYAGARLASDIIDIYPSPIEPVKVKVKLANVNRLIGQTFDKTEIDRLSKALRFNIQWHDDEQFTVDIPTNKSDVLREADVIEEFLRIYGFDNVVVEDRFESALITTEAVTPDRLRESLAGFLVGKGMNQMMGLSLITSAVYKDTEYKDQLVLINNTSNIHLDAMRPEMMASGLQSVAYNLNRQQSNLNLFEFGQSYSQKENKISEEEYVSLFMVGSLEGDSWLANSNATGFYEIKRLVLEILNKCQVSGYKVQETEEERFSFGLSYLRGQKLIAKVGKVSKRWARRMEIKSDVYFAEIPLKTLITSVQKASIEVEDIPKFPSSRRDVALIMDEAISFDQIRTSIAKNGSKLLTEIELFDVYKNREQLGEDKKSYAISLTFVDTEKSLNDKYLDKLVSKIVDGLSKECGVILRK